jgi:hypothetical protein
MPQKKRGKVYLIYGIIEIHIVPRFLYDGIYSIDANFRLKNRMRSTIDPGLGTGWAYFVEDQPYNKYLLKHTSQRDVSNLCMQWVVLHSYPWLILQISSCTGFAALDHANTKKSDGLRVTGVGAVVCARHGLLRPNGIGDLQKGERFVLPSHLMA